MAEPSHAARVVAYYDQHPINEEQILHGLASKGLKLIQCSADDLKALDQDHYGGAEATAVLAAKAGVRPSHQVLDVCAGLGGPARYLAHTFGCHVTGIDFTRSRVDAAQRLSQAIGLAERVRFQHGDAQELPFAPASFDIVIGQEAWAHVPDKPRLIAECARVLRPNGVIAFTDIVRREGLVDEDMDRLREEMTFPNLQSMEGYAALLERNACQVEFREDLSVWWSRLLVERLQMYRSLQDETTRKFGAERHAWWETSYAFFVDLYQLGRLGGARLVARRV
jgi:ubiquinone/menaquinone biosynthesis C-methylase UbiE